MVYQPPTAARQAPKRSRTLTLTDVRVQRLQDISEADAEAEGAPFEVGGNEELGVGYSIGFVKLWNSIHGPDAWDANPWVTAITFTVEQRNIDA